MLQPQTFIPDDPQPLLREVAAPSPFPVAALGVLQEVVEAVQRMTLAPVAIPAASALSVASLCVQGFADIETLGGATRPLSLYFLTIAESGERKSSCDAPLTQAIRYHERIKGKAALVEKEEWESSYAFWRAQRDRISKSTKRDRAAEELRELGPAPKAPRSIERIVTEPTYEGLTRLFAEGQPSLGIFSDEGGQFLGGHAMNSENRQKSMAALNDLWQGNPIRRTRQGDGSLVLYDRRLAMHLMVQPLVARAFMADPLAGDSGFLPRFLICEPTSTIGTRLQHLAVRNDAAIARFSRRVSQLLARPLRGDPETGALNLRTVRLSMPARKRLAEFADNVERAQSKGGQFEHVKGHASKAAEQAARLAGVLTVFEDIEASEVGEQAMAAGIDLASFYLGEALRLSDAAFVSAWTKDAETLRKWLIENWPEADITLSEVIQRAPVRALRERGPAKRALAALVEIGLLIPLDPGTVVRGKARKEAYHGADLHDRGTRAEEPRSTEPPSGKVGRVARIARIAPEPAAPDEPASLAEDDVTLIDYLRVVGPTTAAEAASDLDWEVARVVQSQARLRAAGLAREDREGRLEAVSGG